MTLAFGETQVAQGDTLSWTITLPGPESAVVGDELILTFGGVAVGADTIAIGAEITGYQFALVVPAAVGDGTLTLTASIPAANQTAEASVLIKDTLPPYAASATVQTVAPFPPMLMTLAQKNPYLAWGGVDFVAGTTDTMQLLLADNHALSSATWTLGPPVNMSGSVALHGTVTQMTVPLAIPASAGGDTATLSVALRDLDGNTSEWSFGTTAIAAYEDHPIHSAQLTARVYDLAFDLKRGVVYLSEPDSSRIAVLALAGGTYGTPITVSGRPIGIDLTPDGDSLVVATDSARSLMVLDLTHGGHVARTVTVPNADSAIYVWGVRVSADRRAFVTMRQSDTSEFPVVTAVQSVPLDPGDTVVTAAYVSGGTPNPVARSADGSMVFVPNGTLYTAGTYRLLNYMHGNPGVPWSASVSSVSQLLMSSHWISKPDAGPFGAVGFDSLYGIGLAPSGTDAYGIESTCDWGDTACIRTAPALLLHYAVPGVLNTSNFAAGRLLDVADLPGVAQSVAVSPDGKTVAAFGPTMITLVDLTQSTPPSGARHRPVPTRNAMVVARPPAKLRGAPRGAAVADTARTLRPRLVRVLRRH